VPLRPLETSISFYPHKQLSKNEADFPMLSACRSQLWHAIPAGVADLTPKKRILIKKIGCVEHSYRDVEVNNVSYRPTVILITFRRYKPQLNLN